MTLARFYPKKYLVNIVIEIITHMFIHNYNELTLYI